MDAFEAIGNLLVDASSAWVEEATLAAELHCDPLRLMTAVAGLVAGGLLERWQIPRGTVVTLTPLGAHQLGLHLVETTDVEVVTWSPEAATVRTRRVNRSRAAATRTHADLLDHQADHADRPSVAHRHNGEPMFLRRQAAAAYLPRVLLTGGALVPWEELGPRSDLAAPELHCEACRPRARKRAAAPPVIVAACRRCGFGIRRRPRLGHCPACKGAALSASTYCLRCDRWGLDGFFRRHGFGPPLRRPQPIPRRKAA